MLPLFGVPVEHKSITDALAFVTGFQQSAGSGEFQKYEVTIAFSNGDEVQGIFASKDRATEFLRAVAGQ